MKKITNLADECINAFKSARKSLFVATSMLYQVRETNAYQANFGTFTAFLEDGCGISRGYGSKLLASFEHFVVEGGIAPKRLVDVDVDKLYQASKLSGTVEHQLSKALTLSRHELKLEQSDDDGHTCEAMKLCKHCHKRME